MIFHGDSSNNKVMSKRSSSDEAAAPQSHQPCCWIDSRLQRSPSDTRLHAQMPPEAPSFPAASTFHGSRSMANASGGIEAMLAIDTTSPIFAAPTFYPRARQGVQIIEICAKILTSRLNQIRLNFRSSFLKESRISSRK